MDKKQQEMITASSDLVVKDFLKSEAKALVFSASFNKGSPLKAYHELTAKENIKSERCL